MELRFIFIIAVFISFTGKTTNLSIANLEFCESEVSELSESKSTLKEETNSEFYSLLPFFVLPYDLSFSRLSLTERSLLFILPTPADINRGPPSFRLL
ncbi:hypothetical protein EHQ58_11090 [Leptospira ognonensis]|uniref:Uncharacterized protein n=1 Tax=Leptospira ognonensis TaxID=2484945 RepID=A0A4R9JXL8_9LEPT|nr:hypothetical protein [Leptospira ognonensis]TGL57940.1 hypothetical protein EHQ58_11090 [Leptospira ognonensis]